MLIYATKETPFQQYFALKMHTFSYSSYPLYLPFEQLIEQFYLKHLFIQLSYRTLLLTIICCEKLYNIHFKNIVCVSAIRTITLYNNVIMTSAHDVLMTSASNNTCILITSGAKQSAAVLNTNYFRSQLGRRHFEC